MDYTLALDHDLVAYPNRDSTVYRDRYHIPEARTLVRNTMRYNGFPEIIKALANVGYLDDQKVEYLSPSLTVGLTWKDLTRIIIQAPTSEERYEVIGYRGSKTDVFQRSHANHPSQDRIRYIP